MTLLQLKPGHLNDMFFAIERITKDEYIIVKVFFNKLKCMYYVQDINYERENQIYDE